MKEALIVSLIITALMAILGVMLYYSLEEKEFEYAVRDKYEMTNCVYVKRGNSLENSYMVSRMEQEVVCDDGTFEYIEYTNQYTIAEVERFKNLMNDILEE